MSPSPAKFTAPHGKRLSGAETGTTVRLLRWYDRAAPLQSGIGAAITAAAGEQRRNCCHRAMFLTVLMCVVSPLNFNYE
jgi:hypothetical protein